MANTAQSRKRIRQADARRSHNRPIRSMLRTHIKKVLYAVRDKDQKAAMEAYTKLVPLLDRNARKRIIHKNKAARLKSRLLKHVRALG
ncbi:MAG: 30S ribosomal protein S20 [Gammaproteobacteria bacterium]